VGARHLFLVLTCDSPAAPSLRISLKGVERVFIGRGGLEPRQAPVARSADGELTLSVADDRMSTTHAAIRPVFGNWIIEDAGSRNGTLVNGRPVKREVLADGDLIELGHTFFVFRADVALPAGAPPILDTGDLRPAATGFGTLLPSLAADLARAVAVARSAIPVVIRGETGTGKELVASAIHALSGRQGPFLAVNCGGLSPSLVQSELLGHCKGAFTGAIEDTQGIVRSAQGGTLFLDGIEDLPLGAQPLLLRVLEQAEVVPVGTTGPVKVDVRVVAATQRDLGALAAEERFRGDLLARLSGLLLHLPPLRERREDLGLLIRTLLQRQMGTAAGKASFSCEAARALFLHRWPLNVRELEKALQTAVVLAGSAPIGLRHLPSAIVPPPARQTPASPRPEARAAGPGGRLQHFIDEVSRRRVARVVVAYAIAVFGALQGADVIVTRLSLPPHWMTWIVSAALAGLPLAGVLAWIYDWTREGIVKTAPLSPDQQAALAPGRRRRRRRLALAGSVVVLLACAGALWWRNRAAAGKQRDSSFERSR
jgi:hypothetical protein